MALFEFKCDKIESIIIQQRMFKEQRGEESNEGPALENILNIKCKLVDFWLFEKQFLISTPVKISQLSFSAKDVNYFHIFIEQPTVQLCIRVKKLEKKDMIKEIVAKSV